MAVPIIDGHIRQIRNIGPQYPPVVVALIPTNGKETAEEIHQHHTGMRLLKMAAQLNIKPIACASDGATNELAAQNLMDNEASIDYLVDLCEMPDSGMYRADVVNVDKQDDGAARRFYHPKALCACTEVVDGACRVKDNFKGIFVYQFILGKPRTRKSQRNHNFNVTFILKENYLMPG
jgi:hypothetical protein